MNQEIINKILMPTIDNWSNDIYVIYGTGQIAEYYYRELTSRFGNQAVFCFLNGTGLSEELYMGKRVYKISDLEQDKVNQYTYVLASLSKTANIMKDPLLEYGVSSDRIKDIIPYFNLYELKKAM